ncbi:DHH family phosphoesterase [Thiomicrospira microaerophila]|uniref:single-stranded-DNA-specific exonuclease RecJ n=1 Tax=Thiomicrospira microaerophila TaxID=406020 RepID=UPI00200F5FD8|nr:DHH family phosphoesterase [Thiomicrospira microaerophila]UQB41300.1 DHH family phosphoesterase [Thiomicrospira microaerophila]
MIKPPRIVQRSFNSNVYESALSLGLTPLQAKLVAQRLDSNERLNETLFPQLKYLQHPNQLKNAQQAAELIADAIQSQGVIVLATDYDTDGVTSAWVAHRALLDYFKVEKSRLIHLIGERKNGYGITDEMCDQILALEQPVNLVISADQGSSDEPRIARLAQAGIRVCVTDHHNIPEDGPPVSASCTVNPQQSDCEYDKTIAGCFVIFLVMTQVRQVLIQRGILPADSPSLKALTRHVALGTIADSVSLKSPNNRAIVLAGLQQINQFDQPTWQAFRQFNDNNNLPYNAEFLAFHVASRINAASRVNDVTSAFHFLNADNLEEAKHHLAQLEADNLERRQQQEAMMQQAFDKAAELYHPERFSLAIALEGNAGIQGIIASRIGEKYGLPTVAMTDLNDGTLAGSGRGVVPEIDLIQAFNQIESQQPGIFIAKGGHKGAAGCQIKREDYLAFAELLEQAVKQQLGDAIPSPVIETDGQLDAALLGLDLISQLEQLEPYGREWPQPQFEGRFKIIDLKVIGKTQTHLSLTLIPENANFTVKAVYFGALSQPDSPLPFLHEDWIYCVFQPKINRYMNKDSLQLMLQHAYKLD